jgi:hypothetical protein
MDAVLIPKVILVLNKYNSVYVVDKESKTSLESARKWAGKGYREFEVDNSGFTARITTESFPDYSSQGGKLSFCMVEFYHKDVGTFESGISTQNLFSVIAQSKIEKGRISGEFSFCKGGNLTYIVGPWMKEYKEYSGNYEKKVQYIETSKTTKRKIGVVYSTKTARKLYLGPMYSCKIEVGYKDSYTDEYKKVHVYLDITNKTEEELDDLRGMSVGEILMEYLIQDHYSLSFNSSLTPMIECERFIEDQDYDYPSLVSKSLSKVNWGLYNYNRSMYRIHFLKKNLDDNFIVNRSTIKLIKDRFWEDFLKEWKNRGTMGDRVAPWNPKGVVGAFAGHLFRGLVEGKFNPPGKIIEDIYGINIIEELEKRFSEYLDSMTFEDFKSHQKFLDSIEYYKGDERIYPHTVRLYLKKDNSIDSIIYKKLISTEFFGMSDNLVRHILKVLMTKTPRYTSEKGISSFAYDISKEKVSLTDDLRKEMRDIWFSFINVEDYSDKRSMKELLQKLESKD